MQEQGPGGFGPPPPPAPPPPPGTTAAPKLSEEEQREVDTIKAEGKRLVDAAKAAFAEYQASALEGGPQKGKEATAKLKAAKKAYADFKEEYVQKYNSEKASKLTPLEEKQKKIAEDKENLEKEATDRTKVIKEQYERLQRSIAENEALIETFSSEGSKVDPFIMALKKENEQLRNGPSAEEIKFKVEQLQRHFQSKIEALTEATNAIQRQIKEVTDELKPLKAKSDAVPKLVLAETQKNEKVMGNALEGFIKEWFGETGLLNKGLFLKNLRDFIVKTEEEERKFVLSPEEVGRTYQMLTNLAGVDLATIANIAVGVYKRPEGEHCRAWVGEEQFLKPLKVHESLCPTADVLINKLRNGVGLEVQKTAASSPSRQAVRTLLDTTDMAEPAAAAATQTSSTSSKDKEKGKEKWGHEQLAKAEAEKEQRRKEEERKIQTQVGTQYGKRGNKGDLFSSIGDGLDDLMQSFVMLGDSLDVTKSLLEDFAKRYYQGEGDENVDQRIAGTLRGMEKVIEEKDRALGEEKRKAALLAREAESRGRERGREEAKSPADIYKMSGPQGGAKNAVLQYMRLNNNRMPDQTEYKDWGIKGKSRETVPLVKQAIAEIQREQAAVIKPSHGRGPRGI